MCGPAQQCGRCVDHRRSGRGCGSLPTPPPWTARHHRPGRHRPCTVSLPPAQLSCPVRAKALLQARCNRQKAEKVHPALHTYAHSQLQNLPVWRGITERAFQSLPYHAERERLAKRIGSKVTGMHSRAGSAAALFRATWQDSTAQHRTAPAPAHPHNVLVNLGTTQAASHSHNSSQLAAAVAGFTAIPARMLHYVFPDGLRTLASTPPLLSPLRLAVPQLVLSKACRPC